MFTRMDIYELFKQSHWTPANRRCNATKKTYFYGRFVITLKSNYVFFEWVFFISYVTDYITSTFFSFWKSMFASAETTNVNIEN